MKRFLKWVLRIFLGIVTIILLLILYIQLTYRRKFEAAPSGIAAVNDSAVIARGKYIVMGPGHCWTCHAPDAKENLQKGPAGGMSGGLEIKLPFGTVYTPNITSDEATGIGTYSDEMLARAIRFNIKHDRTAMIPFMSYNGLSDEDLTAVISYLRSTEPVVHEVPKNDINILGKGVMRFMLKDFKHQTPPPVSVKADTTAEYGKYLALNVANCYGCHTNRDKRTGLHTGAPFAGGYEMPAKSGTFTAANLTPHPATGVLSKWTADDFIRRFRMGATYPESPMPWKAYQAMTDNDLKALYHFLKTVEPADNKVTAFRPQAAERKK